MSKQSKKICLPKKSLLVGFLLLFLFIGFIFFSNLSLSGKKALSSRAAPALRAVAGGEGSECGYEDSCSPDVVDLQCFYNLSYFTTHDARQRICHTRDKVWGTEAAPCRPIDNPLGSCNPGLTCVLENSQSTKDYLKSILKYDYYDSAEDYSIKVDPWGIKSTCIPQTQVAATQECGGEFQICCGGSAVSSSLNKCDDPSLTCGSLGSNYMTPYGNKPQGDMSRYIEAQRFYTDGFCFRLNQDVVTNYTSRGWDLPIQTFTAEQKYVDDYYNTDESGAPAKYPITDTKKGDVSTYAVTLEAPETNSTLNSVLNSSLVTLSLRTALSDTLSYNNLHFDMQEGFWFNGSLTFDCGTGMSITQNSGYYGGSGGFLIPTAYFNLAGNKFMGFIEEGRDPSLPLPLYTTSFPSPSICGWEWDKTYSVGPVQYTFTLNGQPPYVVSGFDKMKIRFIKDLKQAKITPTGTKR